MISPSEGHQTKVPFTYEVTFPFLYIKKGKRKGIEVNQKCHRFPVVPKDEKGPPTSENEKISLSLVPKPVSKNGNNITDYERRGSDIILLVKES